MNSNKKETTPFVKYHTGLSLLFTPAETIFILQMVNYEYLKSVGYKISWTKAEYIKRMGMKEYSFDQCVKRLSEMKLLERSYNRLGNKVFYTFNMELYNQFVHILSQNITEEEIKRLKK